MYLPPQTYLPICVEYYIVLPLATQGKILNIQWWESGRTGSTRSLYRCHFLEYLGLECKWPRRWSRNGPTAVLQTPDTATRNLMLGWILSSIPVVWLHSHPLLGWGVPCLMRRTPSLHEMIENWTFVTRVSRPCHQSGSTSSSWK